MPEQKKLTKAERQLLSLKREKELHKGEYLTYEGAVSFKKRADSLPDNGGQDIGERRALRMELQEKYGVSEIEALNILNGRYINEYVDKYYRMQHDIIIVDTKISAKDEADREE